MWLFGFGVYLGVALASLALLSATWLRDVRRARAFGVQARRRFIVLYLFLLLASLLWPLGLLAVWTRVNRRTEQQGLQHHTS